MKLMAWDDSVPSHRFVLKTKTEVSGLSLEATSWELPADRTLAALSPKGLLSPCAGNFPEKAQARGRRLPSKAHFTAKSTTDKSSG